MRQQKKKQLLVKDICARIPFGLKCTTKGNSWHGVYLIRGYLDDKIFLDCPEYNEGDDEWLVQNIVPYLRPMSDMTEEEKREYREYFGSIEGRMVGFGGRVIWATDWLDMKMFDYRGLIPEGLALPAPEGMYGTRTNNGI